MVKLPVAENTERQVVADTLPLQAYHVRVRARPDGEKYELVISAVNVTASNESYHPSGVGETLCVMPNSPEAALAVGVTVRAASEERRRRVTKPKLVRCFERLRCFRSLIKTSSHP